MNLARHERASRRHAGLAAALVFATGCDGCGNHKPYTPFNLDAGPSAAPSESAKRDIVNIISQVYGFRQAVSAAVSDMAGGANLANSCVQNWRKNRRSAGDVP